MLKMKFRTPRDAIRRQIILQKHCAIGGDCDRKWQRESSYAAVEEEFFALWTVGCGKFEWGRRGLACGEVGIIGIAGGELLGGVGIDMDGTPGDGAGCFLIVERKKAWIQGRVDGIGVGIPFGDEAARERDVDGDGGFTRGIEIEDGSFHADGAAKSTLEIHIAKMLDEGGKVGGTGEGQPVHGAAIRAGDGSEGAPFVSGEIGGLRFLNRGVRTEQIPQRLKPKRKGAVIVGTEAPTPDLRHEQK